MNTFARIARFALGLSVLAGTIAAGANAQPTEAWEIGPVIAGRNYSVGMPPTLEPTREGPGFTFPTAGEGHVHYVSVRANPLAGAARIVMRYRIDAPRGTRFVAQEQPERPATVSLYLQRRGDSWSGKRHPFHRWYAPSPSVRELAPGRYEIAVSLTDGGWTSVMGKPAGDNPEAFARALVDADRIGFVFGTSQARGHGVYATAPARFTLLDFQLI